MESSEKYGKDVDEAVRLALEELGLREDQVMVTVLEEPSKGFLSLGAKLAKVRVERVPGADEEEDLTQEEAFSQEEQKGNKAKANHDFRKKNRGQAGAEGQSGKPERADRGDRGDREGDREGRSERGPKSDRGPRPERSDNRRRHDGRQEREEYEGDIDIDIDISGKPSISEPIENLVPDPEGTATKFLTDVVSKMNLEVEIEGFKNDDCVFIEVKGQDARMVIGKRGQTLDSLQYLTNLVSNKGSDEYKRVIIDVEGYRSRREKTLEQLAVKLAKKVLRTGKNARLEPMNPYERKVIHATLQQVEGVKTKSEGEEPYRRVIIERK
jgi:spoIIIJ-associated protein